MSSRAGGTRVEITKIVWMYTRSELSERSLTKISEYRLYISFMYVTNSVWNVFFGEVIFYRTWRLLQGGVWEALAWKSQRLYRFIPDLNRPSAESLIFPNFLHVQKEGKISNRRDALETRRLITIDLPLSRALILFHYSKSMFKDLSVAGTSFLVKVDFSVSALK